MIRQILALAAITFVTPALAENGRLGRTSTGSLTITLIISERIYVPNNQPDYARSKNPKDIHVETNLTDDYTTERVKVPIKRKGKDTGKTTEVIIFMPK